MNRDVTRLQNISSVKQKKGHSEIKLKLNQHDSVLCCRVKAGNKFDEADEGVFSVLSGAVRCNEASVMKEREAVGNEGQRVKKVELRLKWKSVFIL